MHRYLWLIEIMCFGGDTRFIVESRVRVGRQIIWI